MPPAAIARRAAFPALVLIGLLAGAAAASPSAPGDEVDRLVRETMQRERIPGVALLIVNEGRAVRVSTYGLANVEHRVPVKPTTLFQSGSLGKQFTAAALLLLVTITTGISVGLRAIRRRLLRWQTFGVGKSDG